MSSRPGAIVWLVNPDTVSDETIAAGRRLLDAEERRRADRFVYESDRRLFLATHALARLTLSAAAPAVAPADWRFVVNQWGRPALAPPWETTGLHFNVSHTAGLAACALAAHHEVGVDVEDQTRNVGGVAVADRFFAPPEVLALRQAPAAEQRTLFFRLWTLKESYIKARGRGISLGLDRFWFDLSGETPRISWDPGVDHAPETWRFLEGCPTAGHRFALALREPVPEDPSPVEIRDVMLVVRDGKVELEVRNARVERHT